MRVLLPLRKVPANKQTSNSSLSDQSASSGSWLDDEPLGGHVLSEPQQPKDFGGVGSDDTDGEFLVVVPFQVPSVVATSTGELPGEVEFKSETESHENQQAKPIASTDAVREQEQPNAAASLPRVSAESNTALEARHPVKLPTGCNSSIGAHLHRKRKASENNTLADSKLPSRKKRPVEDKKPAAEVTHGKGSRLVRKVDSNMVGARRVASSFRYSDEDSRDCPVDDDDYCYHDEKPHENNPASARGDVVGPHGVTKDDRDLQFFLSLKKRGLEIREQEGDGNCLFRAVSLQVYGDPSMHGDVRRQCLDFMERDEAHFSQFVTGEPFAQYIRRKRQDGVHGNNPEIQAISELFNRPVEVFCPENAATPLNIFHAEYKTDDAPIRLSYHDGNHYNAVVDPLVPTAGLGLGLPGLQPGLADKMQVAKAVAESDKVADQAAFNRALEESQNDELQRAIKESSLSMEHMYNNKALALSDMDATYFELEQAALERSLQSYSNFEQGRKQEASSNRRRRQGRSSPNQASPAASMGESSNCADAQSTTAVASLPTGSITVGSGSCCEPYIPPAAAASSSHVAAVSSSAAASATGSLPDENATSEGLSAAAEYPQTVQELVMNGFELQRVIRAYELIGDNFDDLLSFLISSAR